MTERSQLTFIPWLINELDIKHHAGLEWVDKAQYIATIPWPWAKETLPLEELGVIYCWHKYRIRNSSSQVRSPSTLKGTFRAMLNSRDEISRVQDGRGVIKIQIISPTFLSSVNHCSPSVMSPGANGDVFLSGSITPRTASCSSYPGSDNYRTESVNSRTSSGNGSRTSSWEGSPFDIETAPSWAKQMLSMEQNLTDTSAIVDITVYERGSALISKRIDLQQGLLIYSNENEDDFVGASESYCNDRYGTGSKCADKLFIPQSVGKGDKAVSTALECFQRGVMLSSDPFYNIVAQRNSRARLYFGHSNQGGARQMQRPDSSGNFVCPVFSYISFLEMAGYVMNAMRQDLPLNESDRPTAVTIISVGKEWTPTRPIQSLPLFIEIRHARAASFQQLNLQKKDSGKEQLGGIVISVSNSLDHQTSSFDLPLDLLSGLISEMDVDNIDLAPFLTAEYE